MNKQKIEHQLGTASVSPAEPIVGGSYGQWTITYTVGSHGVDEGGTIKVAQRFASDWQVAQFTDPKGEAYCSVRTDGEAKLRARYDTKGHIRPWMKCIVIDIYDGTLSPGDKVEIVLGDQSHGSRGVRSQTFRETAHEFRIYVDPTNACVAVMIADSPKVRIVAGEAVELGCILPSQVAVGEAVDVFVTGRDVWANPTAVPGELALRWEGDNEAVIEGGKLTLGSPGRGRVVAKAAGMSCVSNPISAHEGETKFNKYWADFHAQTDTTVGTGSEEEYFTFARDVARLDITSHQGNDFQVTDENWAKLNEVIKEFNDPGRFVIFPGYEWSANTCAGGDHNVIYFDENQPIFRSSHWQVRDVPEDDLTPAHPADVLFERLRANGKALVAAHVGGRYADTRDYFDPKIGQLVEVCSCWGIFEWMMFDAFEAGHIIGVLCNSDGHKGRPGAEGPGAGDFGIAGGLTCVLAESLTRESVWEALENRRCYGTTGARIDLTFEIDGQPMGSIIKGGKKHSVYASARGCGPIESLTLMRGREAIETVRPAAFDSCGDSRCVRVSWGGARLRGRSRRVTWDGVIRASGVGIESATPFAFDQASDGITHSDNSMVQISSRTMGDVDGVELLLEEGGRGELVFDSPVGQVKVDLSELEDEERFDFGGIDMHVKIQRFPEQLEELGVELRSEISASCGATTPYFVKVTQSDGQLAFSSPIYIQG